MQSLYTEQNLSDLRGQIRRRVFILLGVALFSAGLVLLTLIMDNRRDHRPEVWTTLAVIFAGASVIFIYDLMIRPLTAYARHMDASLHGRVHEASVIFDRVDGEEISLVDGVRFYSLVFLGDPDKHGDRERMFYWDAELPLPSFAPGQEVSVTYYDRFITSCQLIH